ncbi:MAG: aminoglycoside phosphotransferase family protein [Methylobacter sp.]|nr:aminoglycoside phosphotransferase family protein [Methylobacter sp.]
MNTLFAIAQQFANAVTGITPLGNGLINDTYLVTTPSSPFVLQRINRTVFPEPEQIMANLATLNQHIAQKTAASVKLQIPEILKTTANASLYQDQIGDCWRALSFIADTESIEAIGTIGDAEQAGFALGHFHRLISDLDPSLLHDTLPGFHITPGYLKRYHQVLQQSDHPEDHYCADFIARFQSIADDLEAARQQGLLSLRVIHGDPKLNNFLFDKHTHKILSIIDLDTVKPGLVHYDIGDCLRSCCSTSDPVGFDLDICAALLKSYLSEAGAFFSEHDYHYLYPAIRLIPFELGIRFYTDYLEGNRYFKVTEPEQNLRRAVSQFRLCESIMAQEQTIKGLISQLQSTD